VTNLANVKERLIARKQELEAELKRLSREAVSDEQVPDPADQVAASTMEDITISLQNAEMDEYHKIVDALTMVEQGTYGACADCHNPISEKRLQLYPNATRCLACQELAEEGQ
jgi:DnaK suppressor protein